MPNGLKLDLGGHPTEHSVECNGAVWDELESVTVEAAMGEIGVTAQMKILMLSDLNFDRYVVMQEGLSGIHRVEVALRPRENFYAAVIGGRHFAAQHLSITANATENTRIEATGYWLPLEEGQDEVTYFTIKGVALPKEYPADAAQA
jgi:hypothetical protein